MHKRMKNVRIPHRRHQNYGRAGEDRHNPDRWASPGGDEGKSGVKRKTQSLTFVTGESRRALFVVWVMYSYYCMYVRCVVCYRFVAANTGKIAGEIRIKAVTVNRKANRNGRREAEDDN